MIKIITAMSLMVALTSLALATALAHEDSEEGDYTLVVGFLHEPAYEGERNAVSIRVSKSVPEEAEEHHSESMGIDPNRSGALFASQTIANGASFAYQVPDTLAGMSVPFHSGVNEDMTGLITVGGGIDHSSASPTESHAMSGSHTHGPRESEERISVEINADVEHEGGVNVHLATHGWKWAPEAINGHHVPGEGHAHIYVDGEKVGRVYGSHHYLSGLEPGERHIRVTLNANDHSDLTFEGEPVEASTMVEIPRHGHSHDHDPSAPVAADSPMSLQMVAHPDSGGAYNLQLIPAGFTFSPQNVNGDHRPGEGHGHLYIDGEKITRAYVPWIMTPALSPGMHTLSVVLNTNDHEIYEWNGETVEASTVVHVEAEDDTADQVIVTIQDGAFVPHEVNVMPGSTIVFTNDSGADLNLMSGSADGDMDAMTMESVEKKTAPVEGLQDTLTVEVTHVPSETSKTMSLRTVFGEPGHYVADLIPTSPGHYRFRFFGTMEGTPLDMTFDSKAGGGGFDDVQAASVIHFPEAVASAREVEGVVRSAQTTAQQAQKEAASASGGVSGATTLAIVGIAVGVIGVALGGGGLLMSMRRRN